MMVRADQRRRSPLPEIASVGIVSLLAAAIGIASGFHPGIAIAIIGGLAFIWFFVEEPDWGTWVAIFFLYSNVIAVLVRFHNIPSMLGLVVPGLLAVSITVRIVRGDRLPIVGGSVPWLIAFGFVQFLGAIFADRPEVAWEGVWTFLQEGIILYLLVTNAIRSRSTLRGSLWAVLAAGSVLAAVPCYQHITGTHQRSYGGFGQAGDPNLDLEKIDDDVAIRLSGPIGEQNRFAQILAVLLPIGLCVAAAGNPTMRIVALVCVFLVFAGIALSSSRGAIVAIGLTIVAGAVFNLLDRRKSLGVIIGLCGVLLLVPGYRERLATLVNVIDLTSSGRASSADNSLKGRATEMGAAAYVFLDHPVVGVGPGMFKYYSQEYGERIGLRALKPERQAHSLLFDVAAETGLLGLSCLCAVFWFAFRRLYRTRNAALQTDPEGARLCGAMWFSLTLYFATGLFLHFAFIRYFWVLIALADSTAFVMNKDQSTQIDSPRRLT